MLVDKWREELQSKFGIDARPVRNPEELSTAEDELAYQPNSSSVAYILAQSLLLRQDFETSLRPGLLIADEIHTYRNPNTISYQVLQRLSKSAKWSVGLTATPINNTLDDLVTELSLVLPNWNHLSIEAALKEVWHGRRTSLLSPVLTRFEKEPLKIHFARRSIRTWVVAYPSAYTFSVRMHIKQKLGKVSSTGLRFDEITLHRLATSSPRAFELATQTSDLLNPSQDPKLAVLRRILDQSPTSQFIVFCEFVGTVGYLEEALRDVRRVVPITGETPFFDRKVLLDTFRRSASSVLIMTAVGSEGLDLQSCSRLVNYDLHWNPMILEQRIGRIDRVGQVKSSVDIENITVAGSIDERVLMVLSKKLAAIAQSVFAPQPILESISVGVSAPSESLIVDDAALAAEERRGLELITALTESSKIKLDDYNVLSGIDSKFCDPALLRQLSESRQEPPWLSAPPVRAWAGPLRNAARELTGILSAYS